ncbi:MAG: thiamine pyrophosphate-binding protein [Acidovorax sp.]|uniref:thiamine pyrophosphate-binding protein n=1 Tax=Acidovorax sp. TaxID=1872122 RepID=UPI00391B9084
MSQENKIKVHVAISRALLDAGVDQLFGLVGDANMYVVDSYLRDGRGRYVAAVHEAGAVLMALGYAQLLGRVGVATVTQGPGLTNCLTALVEGVKCALPVLLIAGDTAVEDRNHFQSVNQREFVHATGAGFEQLRSPQTVVQDVARALYRAVVEKRPVVLNMPADYQWMETVYEKPSLRIPETRSAIASSDDMDIAIGMIASAKRPVVIAGRGAIDPEASRSVKEFAQRIEAPVATTLRGKGLFAGDSFDLGICGTLSSEVAVEVIGASDCLIAFGASLNKYTAGLGGLTQNKRIIQINPSATELGKLIDIDIGLAGDPGLTAQAMTKWLDEAEIPGSGYRSDHLREKLAGFSRPTRMPRKPREGTIDMIEAMQGLNTSFPKDRVCVMDGGRFNHGAWSEIDVLHPRDFVHTIAYGAIGLGLGEAVGAAVAANGRPTLCIVGDGGLMLSGLGELSVAVREKLDLVVVVCNDGSYGAEHVHFRNRDMDPAVSLFVWPDFVPMAQALGAGGATVRNGADLVAAFAAMSSADRVGPFLIDIKLDPDCMPS